MHAAPCNAQLQAALPVQSEPLLMSAQRYSGDQSLSMCMQAASMVDRITQLYTCSKGIKLLL
jgi:hypothetical protein